MSRHAPRATIQIFRRFAVVPMARSPQSPRLYAAEIAFSFIPQQTRRLNELRYSLPVTFLRLSHCAVGQDAVEGVDALGNPLVLADGRVSSQTRQLQYIGEGRVGQCERRSVGHSGGHVRDAVVDHAVDLIRGIRMGRRMRGLDAAALIDR